MLASAAVLSQEQVAQLREENQQLRDELKELKRLVFGSKKERFVPTANPNQLSLGLTEDPAAPVVPLKQTVQYERLVKQVVKKAARQLFPAHLPRVEVVIEPTEDVSGMRKMDLPIRSCILGPAKRSLRNWI